MSVKYETEALASDVCSDGYHSVRIVPTEQREEFISVSVDVYGVKAGPKLTKDSVARYPDYWVLRKDSAVSDSFDDPILTSLMFGLRYLFAYVIGTTEKNKTGVLKWGPDIREIPDGLALVNDGIAVINDRCVELGCHYEFTGSRWTQKDGKDHFTSGRWVLRAGSGDPVTADIIRSVEENKEALFVAGPGGNDSVMASIKKLANTPE